MTQTIEIAELRVAIEQELKNIVFQSIPAEYEGMSPMLAYHMGWEGEGSGPEAQGKRIRPVIVLLSTMAAGGDWKKALPAAAAVELIHNFSLIHDDIQDQSTLRRGRKTVWVKWGIAQAINAGDLMFTLAFSAIRRLSGHFSAELVLEAASLLQNTCIQLTGGQFLDLSYEQERFLPEAAYWAMIGGKTAALLAGCTQLGALLAQVEKEKQDGFREFGEKLGLAFQVQDDWLGIWGKTDAIGKSVVSDLVSGKKSLPVVFGLQKQGEFAKRWLSGAVSEAEVPQIAELLRAEGAESYTRNCSAKLTLEALQALKKAANDSACRQQLMDMAELLMKRES